MRRLLHILFALLSLFPATLWADDFEPVVIDNMELGERYMTRQFCDFEGTFRAPEAGLYFVMSTMSDYPMPYRDARHETLYDDFIVSFYDGAQGYVLTLQAGEVVYLFRSFCMNPASPVWVERCSTTLTYDIQPAADGRLVPTGVGQIVLSFSQPVSCDGGSISCAGRTVTLAPQSGTLSLVYSIRDIVMDWVHAGIAPGTDITVRLSNVHAVADPSIKAGDGNIEIHYVMPDAPGEFVRDNFSKRTFKSYWLEDDVEGIFRMTFTRPVNVSDPGFVNIIYGDSESGDIGCVTVQGKADGKDIVFDLREQQFRPKDIIGGNSTSIYDSIRVSPSAIRDDRGEYMFSPGAGTIGSWDYIIPYTWLVGDVSVPWELTDTDENELAAIEPGQSLLFYIYNFPLCKFTGFRFTYEDGTYDIVPLVYATRVEMIEDPAHTDALITITAPSPTAPHLRATVTLEDLRFVTGDPTPDWRVVLPWNSGMELPTLDFTAVPASGERLLPTGDAQIVLTFPQAVSCDGGSISCAGRSVELPAQSGEITLVYDIRQTIMDWVHAGVAAGSDIIVRLNNVHAVATEVIRAGNDGLVELHYVMPAAPGELVSQNFSARTFKSYWLADDEEGVFRMTFTRPVNVSAPGYVNITYGDGDDAGTVQLTGQAEGNDIVFDLRDRFFRPADFLGEGSTSLYESIRVSPAAIRDEQGDYMFSPVAGSLGSWEYTLAYKWYNRQLGTPCAITGADQQPLTRVQSGDVLLLTINDYDYYRFDGVLFSLDTGASVLIPLADLSVQVCGDPDAPRGELSVTVPQVEGTPCSVTVTLSGLRSVADGSTPDWSCAFEWYNPQAGVAGIEAATFATPVYDLHGRRVAPTADRQGIRVKAGRVVLRR